MYMCKYLVLNIQANIKLQTNVMFYKEDIWGRAPCVFWVGLRLGPLLIFCNKDQRLEDLIRCKKDILKQKPHQENGSFMAFI